MGFAEQGWNWGYARGRAHDEAMKLREKLRTEEDRRLYIQNLVTGKHEEELEEAKLAIALRFQSSRRENLTGSETAYAIMEKMAQCMYEENEILLLMDLDALVEELPSAKCGVAGGEPGKGGELLFMCAKALCGLNFIESGL